MTVGRYRINEKCDQQQQKPEGRLLCGSTFYRSSAPLSTVCGMTNAIVFTPGIYWVEASCRQGLSSSPRVITGVRHPQVLLYTSQLYPLKGRVSRAFTHPSYTPLKGVCHETFQFSNNQLCFLPSTMKYPFSTCETLQPGFLLDFCRGLFFCVICGSFPVTVSLKLHYSPTFVPLFTPSIDVPVPDAHCLFSRGSPLPPPHTHNVAFFVYIFYSDIQYSIPLLSMPLLKGVTVGTNCLDFGALVFRGAHSKM